MSALRIAVIGFGFSGLAVTAQLVRRATPGTELSLIAESLTGKGVAYGTTNPEHLLNVPAAKMGASPERIEDFWQWLRSAEGALAQQRLGLRTEYRPTDFAPRMLYAAYLDQIWRQTQEESVARGVRLKWVEATATTLTEREGLAVLTSRGDAIAVDRVILATGNEVKPVLPALPVGQVVQNPWEPRVFDGAARWEAPLLLMGTGLTAVDVVLSLRRAGYGGEIVAFSRHGLLPRAHAPITRPYRYDEASLALLSELPDVVRLVRDAVTSHGEWRAVIDAMRTHTQVLWQRLSTRDQQRFLQRLATLWNVHRHRMAPEIAARMEDEIAQGRLRVLNADRVEAKMEQGHAEVSVFHLGKVERFTPSCIVNCTGPQLVAAKSSYRLITQALADGLIEPHATGIGLALDPHLRAWGVGYPQIYAMGALSSGQLLESTAVPELRVQAAQIAETLFPDIT